MGSAQPAWVSFAEQRRITFSERRSNPKLKALTFINRGDPRGQDNGEAAEALKEVEGLQFIDVVIGTRKAFGNAAALGLAVAELKTPDPKATEEMLLLYKATFGSN
jgi:chromosome partitioning protein